jgi:outer membrane lipoprotein carrier protein
MKIKQLLAAVVVAAAPGLAFGADAAAQLRDFVAKVASASGQFSQQTIIRQGSGKPAQTGEFAFQRPGKFKWAIQKPYEQLIVSDGKVVYQYDPDLLQVTERSVDQSVGASPAAILFGSGSLDDAFKVAALPDADGLQWLRATPRTASAGFAHVDIGFQNNIPHRLDVLDSFGQTTRIELSQMVLNPTLADDAFRFVAPKGVDVVKMP